MKQLLSLALTCLIAGCATPADHHDNASSSVGMANPASVACVKQGGNVDLRKDDAGNVTGICVLPDHRECEEWALYRDGKCVMPPGLKP
jgi:uncharacterized protein